MNKHNRSWMTMCICLIMVFVIVIEDSAFAAYGKHSTYNYSLGTLLWKKTYNCIVYRETNNYTLAFEGSEFVTTGFERKETRGFVLSQSRNFSVDAQTVETLNGEIDFKKFKFPAKIGGSVETTSAKEWGVSNATERTVYDSDPRGYYSYNVCLNVYKLKVTGSAVGTVELYAPKDKNCYRALIYNANSPSIWGAKVY